MVREPRDVADAPNPVHGGSAPVTGVQAELWFTITEDVNPALLAQYETLLSDAEKLRAKRFAFARDRCLFVIGRALVRTSLSRRAAVDPADWRFVLGPFGQPRITPDHGYTMPFSITHTDGIVACLLANQGRVGVDAERLDRKLEYVETGNRLFAVAEALDLRSTPVELQRERFYRYWTAKEAFVKACGKGLALPFESFTVELKASGAAFAVIPEDAPYFNAWRVAHLRPTPTHLLAVAVANEVSGTQELDVRRSVPLGPDGDAYVLAV